MNAPMDDFWTILLDYEEKFGENIKGVSTVCLTPGCVKPVVDKLKEAIERDAPLTVAEQDKLETTIFSVFYDQKDSDSVVL